IFPIPTDLVLSNLAQGLFRSNNHDIESWLNKESYVVFWKPHLRNDRPAFPFFLHQLAQSAVYFCLVYGGSAVPNYLLESRLKTKPESVLANFPKVETLSFERKSCVIDGGCVKTGLSERKPKLWKMS